MDDLVSEFLGEANESLSELDTQLVALEQNPEDAEIIGSIFRVMHTIKGTCGFLGLPRLEAVAHAGEDILDNIRSDKLEISQDIITAVLDAIDRIKEIIEVMEEEGTEPEGDDSELIKKLRDYAEGGAPAAAEPAEAAPAEESAPAESEGEESGGQDSADLQAIFDSAPGPGEEAPAEESPKEESGGNDSADLQAIFDAAPGPEGDDEAPTPPAAEEKKEVEVPAEAKKEAVEKGLETAKSAPAKKPAATQSIRVNLNLLENLMQMAGELVLTRNQLAQISRKTADSAFSTPLQKLSTITTEIQESVMKTRMQPIGNAWAKFPRLIRDLSVDLEKKIELKMVGAETELDRQMLEMVKDPLTHMVRNAADHGLDTPEERLAAGKEETGTVTLSSYHEGGHVIVKVSDDGRGINAEKVIAKAIENGLATEGEANTLTDKQIYQFILKPGFSTAAEVTAVSGRGVGMDVVVSNIEAIGGTLEVDSVPGKGSDFIIKLPLTLAIMSVLIVESSKTNYAIPQIRVSEVVHAFPKSVLNGQEPKEDEFIIEDINDTPVLRLRGKLLPLTQLNQLLNLPDIVEELDIVEEKIIPEVTETASEEDIDPAIEESSNVEVLQPKKPVKNLNHLKKHVVVCEVGSSSFGIVVDKVFDTEEIVVKPKSPFIRDVDIYSGSTILGDGEVIMILDPNGIMKTLGDVASNTTEDESSSEGGKYFDPESNEEVSFLLFRAGGKAPKAVPLELVSRLEEIENEQVEWAGDKQVIQYRDHLMRLITTDDSYSVPTEGISEVIVFNDDGKILGLVVEEVLDIAHNKMDIRSLSGENGTLGSMVIENITYDLIDVGHHFSQVFSDWLASKPTGDGSDESIAQTGRKKLLLVDDSPFFRKFMKPILVVADYEVTTADSAIKALEILKEGAEFDVIITDIDMPEMDGIEFVRECRKEEKYLSMPFIALTSFSSDDLANKGEDVKFDGFVSKSDRDKLVDTIGDVLSNAIQEHKEAS